ncbi:FtsW/RodA/SpoVE family cell cycle protein [Picosynechococcus sp. PCC 7117]|uniref:FtsW/RodA/SpoVE family cell cycle protein n=1 Tax=Picosynechococcus sp. PCC 7117 TaxID=195498 RepID=UPI0008103CF0|nr:FtsW/RodA/SpoVE family cell cycle protein [Picosynechococcus sp. PCC 7117]ANV87088.1 cell division protein FtsW [Picosynechococcus sp. PCC 7117]
MLANKDLLHHFLTYFTEVKHWALEARLLRWLTLLWLGLGLVTLFSASYPVAAVDYGDGWYYVKRQIVWAIAGLICAGAIARVPLKKIRLISFGGLIISFGLILLTIVGFGRGSEEWGASRWIGIAGFALQPSEFAKPFLVLEAANVFSRWRQLKIWHRAVWLSLFAGILLAILKQPNLSTTALCGMTIWFIALAAGIPWLLLGGAAGVGGLAALASISVNSYQRERLTFFLDPFRAARDEGYQLVQSLLAVSSGGGWGLGFGESQQKLFFLPIQHTDFIFAIFAEEFGLIGSLGLLGLLFAYASLGSYVAWRSPVLRHRLIAIGATFILIGQSLLNIGVATGALPTTGLPLPLFSYGGSSIISSLMLAGLLVRIARENGEATVISLAERRQQRQENPT